jgi:hypothetical protein
VTPVQSISETDIMPASHANTSYANILCQIIPIHLMLTSYANSYQYILCQLIPIHLMIKSYASLCQHTSSREAKLLAQKKLKMFASRGLVRISATCSAVGKYSLMSCFIDTTSWTKQTLRSMCFTRRELPELHLMEAVLSSMITVGSLFW